MLFNVSGLIQDGIGATRQYEVDGSLATPGRDPEPLAGSVELLKTLTGVLVRARLQLEMTAECSRCLQPLHNTIRLEFEEEFQVRLAASSTSGIDNAPESDYFWIDEHHMLDLTEAVRQYRETAADMQPLCRPDCQGLCPNCGGDLNTNACRCQGGVIDERWAGLSSLRGILSEGKE